MREEVRFVGQGTDLAFGGGETGVLFAGGGDDPARGGGGDDVLFGGAADDRVVGGGGNDLVFEVDPMLLGGPEDPEDVDLVDGGTGFDTLVLPWRDAAVADDLAAAVGAGDFAIDALGIAARSIERVVAYAGRGLPADLDELGTAPALADALATADVWGVGLPARAPDEAPVRVFEWDVLDGILPLVG